MEPAERLMLSMFEARDKAATIAGTADSKLLIEMFAARDKAITVAVESLSKRLDGMNEFRDALKDQAATFLTRDEFQARHDQLLRDNQRIERLVWMAVGGLAVIVFIIELVTHFNEIRTP